MARVIHNSRNYPFHTLPLYTSIRLCTTLNVTLLVVRAISNSDAFTVPRAEEPSNQGYYYGESLCRMIDGHVCYDNSHPVRHHLPIGLLRRRS
jgi:hypothetical protein